MTISRKNINGIVISPGRRLGAGLRSYALVLASVLILAGPFFADAEEKTISWMLVNWPPFVIQDGRFSHQGSVDETVQLLAEKMPGYRHEIVYSSAKRLFFEIEKRNNICSAAWLKNKARENVAAYSIAYAPAPALMLVTTQEKAKTFSTLRNQDNAISLRELLKDHPELRPGIISKRSYTPGLDQIIARHGDNLVRRTAGDLGNGLLKMLDSDRIDYTIEYPHVITYTVREMLPGMAPYFIPIREIETQVLFGHVICSEGIFGRQAIQEVDQVLRQEMKTILGFYEKWFNPEAIELLKTSGAYEFLQNQ